MRLQASCSKLNAGSITAYYNDSQAEDFILRQLIPYLAEETERGDFPGIIADASGGGKDPAELLRAAWERLNSPVKCLPRPP